MNNNKSYRNPEKLIKNEIKIKNNRDIHNKLLVTHSYNKNGAIFHKQYSLTDSEISELIKNNKNSKIIYSNSQDNNYNTIKHNTIKRNTISRNNINNYQHREYQTIGIPIPLNSYKEFYNIKHTNPINLNILDNSNISGNFIN